LNDSFLNDLLTARITQRQTMNQHRTANTRRL